MPHVPSSYGAVPAISVTSYGKIGRLSDRSHSPSPQLNGGYSNPYYHTRPLSNFSSCSNSITSDHLSSPSRLPPPVPSNQRRITPIRRAYTANLEGPCDRLTPRRPLAFQARPLRNLTVVSQSQRSTPVRSLTRSPSPSLSNGSCTPRRVFPQVGTTVDLDELDSKEEAPVVFDANLTFVLGCKGKMRQNFKPIPAHLDDGTASNYLSNKIADFLERTDHVMDEWKSLGHKDNSRSERRLDRSKSATNIMIKGFQYFSRASSASRSSVARSFVSDDATEAQADEVTNQITRF